MEALREVTLDAIGQREEAAHLVGGVTAQRADAPHDVVRIWHSPHPNLGFRLAGNVVEKRGPEDL